jgi:hypothetical protein
VILFNGTVAAKSAQMVIFWHVKFRNKATRDFFTLWCSKRVVFVSRIANKTPQIIPKCVRLLFLYLSAGGEDTKSEDRLSLELPPPLLSLMATQPSRRTRVGIRGRSTASWPRNGVCSNTFSMLDARSECLRSFSTQTKPHLCTSSNLIWLLII